MVNSKDLMRSVVITEEEHNGKTIPTIVSEVPADKCYSKLTEVVIDTERVKSLGNDVYLLEPDCAEPIIVYDEGPLMIGETDCPRIHIVFTTDRIFDQESNKFIDYKPTIMYAKALPNGNCESEFMGLYYIFNDSPGEIMLDEDYYEEDDYFKSGHINTDYVITINCNVLTLNSMKYDERSDNYIFNDDYYAVLTDNKTCRFLELEGAENVLKGKTVSFMTVEGESDYSDENWFMVTDFLYNDFDIVS